MEKKESGFTLIELMIVIAIIALLASVALPKFTGVTKSAKAAKVQGDLANLRTSIAMFYAKEGSYPEYKNDATSPTALQINAAGDIGTKVQEYYSKKTMPKTPKGDNSAVKTNAVKSTANSSGGWVYTTSTGAIHADLADGEYGQGVNWPTE